jgi:hypothetical protein
VTAFAINVAINLAQYRHVFLGFAMRFRLTAFGLHLLASATALTLVLGSLYLGWYRWPAWYLSGVIQVVTVMVSVDLVLGPTITLLIASPKKPRRELVRDISLIATVQLCALAYGSLQLWNGRPLYYAFSENVIQLVQAYDIGAEQAAQGRQQNPDLAPHWYSLPRWICAPLPQDPDTRQKIVADAVLGGDDVIAMPKYYQSWDSCLPALRGHLNKVDIVPYFVPNEKKVLKARMKAAGLPNDQLDTMPMSGRGHPLLAVFDLTSLKIKALFSSR